MPGQCASSISQFVKSGALLNALGQTGLDAARNTLATASLASDYNAHIRSAINHLEYAATEVERVLENGRGGANAYQENKVSMPISRVVYIKCLPALRYKYVGENGLASHALDAAAAAHDRYWEPEFSDKTVNTESILYFFDNALNPANHLIAITGKWCPRVDVADYRRELSAKPR